MIICLRLFVAGISRSCSCLEYLNMTSVLVKHFLKALANRHKITTACFTNRQPGGHSVLVDTVDMHWSVFSVIIN